MFGKTMSIPDELISNWFELCTDVPMTEVRSMLEPGKNPRDAKVRLGREIVALYHGSAAADEAVQYFVDTFSKRQQPVEAEEAEIPSNCFADRTHHTDRPKEGDPPIILLPNLIAELGMAKSNGAARDLITAGAVALDGEKITTFRVPYDDVKGKTLKVGKHQFRKLV